MQQEHVNLSSEQQKEHADNSENMVDMGDKSQGRWDQDQHMRFLEGLFKYGKNWKQIETLVGTRVCSQVRSHAQKYFIKLQKIIKDRKKQKNKQTLELTDIQREVLEKFTSDDVTDKTPQILVSLLQNQCLVPGNKMIEKNTSSISGEKSSQKKGFKKVIKRKSSDESPQKQEKNIKKGRKIQAQQKQNMKSEKKGSIVDLYYDQEQDQEKSFFCRVIENNVQHFRQGKDFSVFIDFEGHAKNQEDVQSKAQEIQSAQSTRNRRSSFTLVDDQHQLNDQKLKQALVTLKSGQKPEMEEK